MGFVASFKFWFILGQDPKAIHDEGVYAQIQAGIQYFHMLKYLTHCGMLQYKWRRLNPDSYHFPTVSSSAFIVQLVLS